MPAAASLQLGVPGSVYRDALTGLEGLGYAEAEAAPVLKNILHEEPDLEVSEALSADRKSTRLNSSHSNRSRMPSSA